MLLDIPAKALFALASSPLRRSAAVFIALTAMALAIGSVLAEEGTVEGKLRNGTAGAVPPAGQEVTLQSIGKDGMPTPVMQAKADAQGSFRFTGVESSGAVSYTVSTQYQGATYWSNALSVGTGQRPADLLVFEPTDDKGSIAIELAHGVLQTTDNSKNLWVVEVLVLSNKSDRTYLGDPGNVIDGVKPTVIFTLPPGATHFQPMQGINPDALIELPNGFADTEPLQPGSQTVAYSYLLAPTGATTTFARKMDYPTARYVTLVPESVGSIDTGALVKGEPAEIGGERYQTYVAQSLSAGTTISVRFGGRLLPWLPFDDRTSAGMAAGVIVVVAGASVIVWRRRKAEHFVDEPDEEEIDDGLAEREALLAELADLEASYQTGDVDEREYNRTRAAHERRLAQLVSEDQ